MKNFSRRALMRSAGALGLVTSTSPLHASIDKRTCDLERRHGDWRISIKLRSKYGRDDAFRGTAFYVELRHMTSGITLDTMTAAPNALYETLKSDRFPRVRYEERDVLDAFALREHPKGREKVTTFLLIRDAEKRDGPYILWDYEPDHGECTLYSGCERVDAFENPTSTYGWTDTRRTSVNDVRIVARMIPNIRPAFGRDRLIAEIGYHDTRRDKWPRLATYELDATGLGRATRSLLNEADQVRKTLAPSTCGSSTDDLDCFLTSACCTCMGRSDDCIELRTLRGFRDGWLARHPQGHVLIAEYYRTAPAIVRAMSHDPQRLRALYWGTILPCVAAIKLGANELAFRLYCRMMRRLQTAYPRG